MVSVCDTWPLKNLPSGGGSLPMQAASSLKFIHGGFWSLVHASESSFKKTVN